MQGKRLILKLSAIIILCVASLGIYASDALHKMSPFVRQAVASSETMRRVGATGVSRCITVFIRVAENEGVDNLLADNGCKILDRQGDIVIAQVPLSSLNAIAKYNAIKRIEAGRPCKTTMDTTVNLVDTQPVYDAVSLPQAYTGDGVIMGVVDIGFDLTHPNFYDSSLENYRIKAFWDQLSKDTVGSSFPVGRDYVGKEDILAYGNSADGKIQSHGTHTLGIAAGSGYTSRYRGMAFDSDICLVSNAVSDDYELIDSTDYYKYTTATDALGFKYIFDYADSQSKPCVISFSEGYYFGYSGEDSLFCEYLTGLTGPGHIIVASAGNESQYVGYLCKPSGADEAGSFLYSNGNSATYYVQSRDAFHMCFLTYGTSEIDTLTIESSQCSTDYTTSVFSFVQKDTGAECRLSIDRYPSSFIVGDTVYCVSIESDVTISSLSPIALVLTGTQSEVSARGVSSSMFANGLADDKWNDAEISHNVLAPGCFDGIITVGATIHRTSFTNYLGNYCEYPQAGRNDGVRSYYSSIGPGVDGNIKPDIVAPGDNIVSSYSSFYLEANPNANDKSFDIAYFDYNGRTYLWHSSTGTSMSTPVVAGAIALWLQAKPDLTPEEIIDVFSRTSRKPETELSYPNNYYGYGEIDVYKGLLDILGISGIKEISKSQPSSVHVSIDESGTMILTFDSVPQNDVDVSVYSISGTLLYKDTISPTGSFTVRKTMLSIPESIVIVQLKGIDKGVTGSTIIRK